MIPKNSIQALLVSDRQNVEQNGGPPADPAWNVVKSFISSANTSRKSVNFAEAILIVGISDDESEKLKHGSLEMDTAGVSRVKSFETSVIREKQLEHIMECYSQ
jgi:hypothetical protein